MLTVVDVNFDRSDMMLEVANGKTITRQTVPSEQIARIQFGQESVKSWFSSKTVPKVEIFLKGKEEPLVLQSGKTKLPIEKAQEFIRQFAEKHDVSVERVK